MKQVHRNKFSWLGMLLIVMMMMPFAAFADDISNNLDASVEAVAEVMSLNVGGTNGTTQLYVTPANGDGKNGCNLTGSTTLGLSITSSNPSVATVSPASVTFTGCGDTPTLTITPVAQGSATISAAQTSNNTGATFNLAPVTFTVNVAPPAITNTAPMVSVDGVAGGVSYNKGSVPAATCQVTDTEDGNSSFAATLSAVTGPYASDGIGEQTASCSYTDGGGLIAEASITYSIVDPSEPSISYILNPDMPDGTNSWYKGNVTLTWTVSESESPSSLVKTGCVDQSITADQTEQTYTCSATSAGGSAGPVEVKIKRDATTPAISSTGPTPAAPNGDNGWYITAVSNAFTANDATSGLADTSQANFTQSSGTDEGAAVKITSGSVSDKAGNTASGIDSAAFKIDLSDPYNVAFVGGPSASGSYYFGSVPTAPTCTADDDVSGFASCVVSGYSAAVGSHTLTATATDNAGRQSTNTLSYTVLAWTLNGFYQPVDMRTLAQPDVWNTVKNGSTIPLKFEVFAGANELTDTSIVSALTKQVTCNAGSEDTVEVTATGGTSLRYDATAGQFVYNWQTPKLAGKCYAVTLSTNDGSSLTAFFKLK